MTDTLLRYWNGLMLAAFLLLGSVAAGNAIHWWWVG